MIPASNPRLVTVVVINDPQGGHYYGGSVAGPAFAQVMEGAVRLLDIPPDNVGRWYVGRPEPGRSDRYHECATAAGGRQRGGRGGAVTMSPRPNSSEGFADASAAGDIDVSGLALDSREIVRRQRVRRAARHEGATASNSPPRRSEQGAVAILAEPPFEDADRGVPGHRRRQAARKGRTDCRALLRRSLARARRHRRDRAPTARPPPCN